MRALLVELRTLLEGAETQAVGEESRVVLSRDVDDGDLAVLLFRLDAAIRLEAELRETSRREL